MRAARALFALSLCWPAAAAGQPGVQRVIIFKFDGVNANLLDQWISQRNPQTGRSELPWMEQIFARQGTRFDNFYVRGISLSAPSWAMLDSGHPQVIRGNVEYDRWTLHPYDYLNFFPFYVGYSEKKRVDMPSVEVLDEAGVPLLIDAFQPDERWQSYQLYQRGNDWSILQHSVPDHFRGRSPKEWFDEWQTGLQIESSIPQEMERKLIAALGDDKVVYLDFFSGDYDHVAHLTNDPQSQLRALQGLDAMLGRIWTAAMASKLGPHTVAVIVSDHGMNTEPAVMSQGYSLVDWFNSVEGGGHHVITDRYPLSDLKLRGLDPFVHKVTNASADSIYLKGDAPRYPTVLLDVDGNERAAVQLRSNDWNIVQLLLQKASDKQVGEALRSACRAALEGWAAAHRTTWDTAKTALVQQLATLDLAAQHLDDQAGKDKPAADPKSPERLDIRRAEVRAREMRDEAGEYRRFIASRDALLAMPANADESLVPRESLGDPNSLYDLQNYVVGPAPGGFVLNDRGRIDLNRSLRRIDYFQAIQSIHVRNQVQKGIGSRPVDFIAVKLDPHAAESAFSEPGLLGAVWLSAGLDRQGVIVYRELYRAGTQQLQVRYIPIARLQALPDGSLHFDSLDWQPGLPLQVFEDPQFDVPTESRAAWLAGWHNEAEWFAAIHRTRYSNGVIGIIEQFRPISLELPAWTSALRADDRARWLQLERKSRDLVQPDFEIFAADHWNFNVRGFNPGGNHGSFLRISTHSVLMFAGGADSGIPRGVRIQQPYDSLNFAPTVLSLMGRTASGAPLPGAPIPEVHGESHPQALP